MLLAHEITTYHAPYPDRIERDVESVGGATRALRLGRPVLRRAPRSDRVYWTTEEYQRDYSARSALALGLRILRAQRREDRDARKSASCLACREECWFHDARHTLCPRCLSVLGVRSA